MRSARNTGNSSGLHRPPSCSLKARCRRRHRRRALPATPPNSLISKVTGPTSKTTVRPMRARAACSNTMRSDRRRSCGQAGDFERGEERCRDSPPRCNVTVAPSPAAASRATASGLDQRDQCRAPDPAAGSPRGSGCCRRHAPPKVSPVSLSTTRRVGARLARLRDRTLRWKYAHDQARSASSSQAFRQALAVGDRTPHRLRDSTQAASEVGPQHACRPFRQPCACRRNALAAAAGGPNDRFQNDFRRMNLHGLPR